MRRFLTVVAGLVLPLTITVGSDQRTLTVESLDLVVPLPEGFVEVCQSDNGLRDVFAATVPSSNELLACFLTEKDHQEYRESINGLFSPYFMLQVMTVTKPGGLPHSQYAQFVSSLETQFATQFEAFWDSIEGEIEARTESSSAALTKHLGTDVKLSLNQSVPIETSRESDNVFISVWMTKGNFDIAGQDVPSRQVQTSAALYVKGRVFIIFGYRTYESESDAVALKDATRVWTGAIVKSNERPPD